MLDVFKVMVLLLPLSDVLASLVFFCVEYVFVPRHTPLPQHVAQLNLLC